MPVPRTRAWPGAPRGGRPETPTPKAGPRPAALPRGRHRGRRTTHGTSGTAGTPRNGEST
ncbi:hypothetical protein DY218_20130 [Streptomyces triticagri]|uniref:Uncharacterized protein n=1 Tax=Streptomyces triticagri TaxID=2293568 RepID=A0A372M380_9ACTN|nr:hypothetical protein DY218_20130 [Streptomyces triticagri]